MLKLGARSLKLSLCVLCLVSCVLCLVSCVLCLVSCVLCLVSCVLCLVSCVLRLLCFVLCLVSSDLHFTFQSYVLRFAFCVSRSPSPSLHKHDRLCQSIQLQLNGRVHLMQEDAEAEYSLVVEAGSHVLVQDITPSDLGPADPLESRFASDGDEAFNDDEFSRRTKALQPCAAEADGGGCGLRDRQGPCIGKGIRRGSSSGMPVSRTFERD